MRRKRVELESAVVRCAQNFIASRSPMQPTGTFDAYLSLSGAVDDLNAYLPLEPVPHQRGAWVEGSPETSRAAALVMPRGKVTSRVLAHIRNAHWHGAVGSTDAAMEKALHLPHQTLSSARNALVNGGWLMDSGLRRQNPSLRFAAVWTLTPGALAALEQKETA
jgi:hypothetical protein